MAIQKGLVHNGILQIQLIALGYYCKLDVSIDRFGQDCAYYINGETCVWYLHRVAETTTRDITISVRDSKYARKIESSGKKMRSLLSLQMVLYSGIFSLVKSFAKSPLGPPEEIFVVFIFALTNRAHFIGSRVTSMSTSPYRFLWFISAKYFVFQVRIVLSFKSACNSFEKRRFAATIPCIDAYCSCCCGVNFPLFAGCFVATLLTALLLPLWPLGSGRESVAG